MLAGQDCPVASLPSGVMQSGMHGRLRMAWRISKIDLRLHTSHARPRSARKFQSGTDCVCTLRQWDDPTHVLKSVGSWTRHYQRADGLLGTCDVGLSVTLMRIAGKFRKILTSWLARSDESEAKSSYLMLLAPAICRYRVPQQK